MPTNAPTLSEHLLAEARKFQFYPRRVPRTRINLETSELIDSIIRDFVGWRKTFKPHKAAEAMERLGQAVFVDELYCRELLGHVPAFVARTLQLSALSLGGISKDSYDHLREAANCYILDFLTRR